MTQKLILAIMTAALLCASTGASSALTVTALQTVGASSMVQEVSFWGQAFPYGYNWSVTRACTRYEPVETAHGTHMERVWVCGTPERYHKK
jgi:hypothetical protein